jgi:methionine biosynthesis protein MetW
LDTEQRIAQSPGAGYFDQYWRGANEWKPSDARDGDLMGWMAQLVRPGCRLLDIGCGDGSRYAAELIACGVEVHGTDISPLIVAAASQNGVKAICVSLDEKLPYERESFDAAVCLEVFQHLFDPEFAAREVFDALRPGGLFLASVPNVGNWRSRFDMLVFGRIRSGGSPQNVRYPWRDPHLRLFNSKAIADMLRDVGFEIVRSGGLHVNFLTQVPGLRRFATLPPIRVACQGIGRQFYSLLAGRCVLLARKPNA